MSEQRKIRSSGRWKMLSQRMRRTHPVCFNPFDDHSVKPCDEVHHKIPIRKDPSLAFDPKNLVTLCRECHDKVDSLEEIGYDTQFLWDETRHRGDKNLYATTNGDRRTLPKLNVHDIEGGGGCKRIETGVFCEKLNKTKLSFCGACPINKERMK